MAAGKKPDYNLSAMDKDNDRLKGTVGVAWINEDGTISIRLNPFVVLDTREHTLELRLFKNDGAYTKQMKKPKSVSDESGDKYLGSGNEIPF